MKFLYGKWTDFIRCTDYSNFEEYYKENAHKFRRGDDKKGGESPSHTPKKVLAKLNSLKMGVSFKSQNSQAEVKKKNKKKKCKKFFENLKRDSF